MTKVKLWKYGHQICNLFAGILAAICWIFSIVLWGMMNDSSVPPLSGCASSWTCLKAVFTAEAHSCCESSSRFCRKFSRLGQLHTLTLLGHSLALEGPPHLKTWPSSPSSLTFALTVVSLENVVAASKIAYEHQDMYLSQVPCSTSDLRSSLSRGFISAGNPEKERPMAHLEALMASPRFVAWDP